MKLLTPFLFVFLLSLCNSKSKFKGGEQDIPYEIPPTAPIPPEDFCYERHAGAENMYLHISIAGDSVQGNLAYTGGTHDKENGQMTGIIYGNTLIISYTSLYGGKSNTEDQEWKMVGDSIYRRIVNTNTIMDSTKANKQETDSISFMPALYKVICKGL